MAISLECDLGGPRFEDEPEDEEEDEEWIRCWNCRNAGFSNELSGIYGWRQSYLRCV